MLHLTTSSRDLLQFWVHAFPASHFETLTISWAPPALRVDAISASRSMLGRLEIGSDRFNVYNCREAGSICVLTEELVKALGFALIDRHKGSSFSTEWDLASARVSVRVNVAHWGSLTRILAHVPDSLFKPPPDPRFESAARLTTESPKVFRDIHDSMTSADVVRVALQKGRASVAYSSSSGNRFEPSEVLVEGDAQTLIDKASIDIASRCLEYIDPTRLVLSVIDGGMCRIRYEHPLAMLTYLIAAVIESE